MMDLLWMVNKIRYMKPIESLIESKGLVLPLALFTTILNHFVELFQTDWDLVVILLMVFAADLVTGLIAAKRRKNPLNSLGMRQSIIKFIEYSIFIGITVLIANGFEKYATDGSSTFVLEKTADFVKDIDVFAFLGLIWIEVVSIVENFSDEKGAIRKVVKNISEEITKKINKKE